MLSLRRMFLSARARYHLWSGHRAYRSGRMRRAGQHFREALAAGAESFEAWLLLGKIYYRQNDMSRAADAFGRARTADPSRFHLEGYPEDFVDQLAARGRTSARPEYRIVIQTGAAAAETPARKPSDRPTIQPDEAVGVDWDAAARELFGD